jgi:DNA-binding XRE family transcriptional regulator
MNLKELRTQFNLTQAALAKELGVTSNTISAIEGGRLKLSDKLSAKIDEVYGGAVAAAIAEAEKAFETEAKAAVAEMEAFAAEVEKAVVAEEKAEKKKARAAKKKAEAEAEQIADTVSAFVAEVGKAFEPEAEKKKAHATKKKVEAEKVTAAAAIPETEKKAEKKTRKVKAKAKADNPAAEMVAEAVTAPVEAAVEAATAPVEAAAEKKSRKMAPAKKKALAPKKTQTAPKAPVVILQSLFGGEITAEEIINKVGSVDKVYVRIDQNKAYWVKGEENGEVDLW